MKSSEWRIGLAFAAASFAITAALCIALMHWSDDAFDLHHSGWHQGDFPTYLCYARRTSDHTLGLTYAQAHDLRSDAPAPFLNLGISLLGALLALGVAPEWTEQALRLVGGTLMLTSLAWAMAPLFRRRRAHVLVWLLTSLGGGLFAARALWENPSADLGELATQSRLLQGDSYWWFLSVFRTQLYSLETLYHSLVFTMVGALVRRRFRLGTLCLAFACLANPFAGIQAAAAFFLCFALRWRWPELRSALPALGIVALFGVYYGALVPLDPVGASLADQHRGAFTEALPWKAARLAYGALLVPLVLVVRRRGRRRGELDLLVPFLALAASAFFLSQHSRVMPDPWVLQPMHFTRGYIFAGLSVVSGYVLWTRSVTVGRRWQRALGASAFAALFALLMSDTVVFAYEQTRVMGPHQSSLRWNDEQDALLHFLQSTPPGTRVSAQDWQLSRLVCALGEQRSAFGTRYTTPFYDARNAEFQAMLRCESESDLAQWTDLLVVRSGDQARSMGTCEAWQQAYENPSWVVFRRMPKDHGQPGHGVSKAR